MPQPINAGISDAGGAMTARTDSVNLGAVGEGKGKPDGVSRNPNRYRGGVSDGVLPPCFFSIYVK